MKQDQQVHRTAFGSAPQVKRLPQLVGIALLSLGTSLAHAQANAPKVQTADEIVVSSSRIDRQGFTAPTPTTVIGADVLQQRGTTNFADLLNELPSFKGSISSATGTPFGLTNGNGANLADLRGLGPVRTLVLVDRHRFVASTNTGRVDLNQIPTSLIQQMDVVTGGASAAYGSDAVSGVVNVMLKKNIDGILGTIQYGQSSKRDAKTSFISLAGGTSFAGTRGQVIAGLEYNNDTGVVDAYRRDWGSRENYFVALPPNRAAGLPAYIHSDNVHYANITNGGLVAAGPLQGLDFTATGTRAFNYGLAGTGFAMLGGDNAGKTLYAGVPLDVPLRRLTGLARVTYDITDDITAYAELSYATTRGITTGLPRRDTPSFGNSFLTILPTNPYLQAKLTPAQLALVPATGIPVGRFSEDLGYPRSTNDNRTQRILGGLNGTFGGGWKWDVSAQTGQNNLNRTTTGQIVGSRFQSAINAISLGGVIVCADPVARAAGCQPLNILGTGAPDTTPAGKAYVMNDAWYKQKSTLDDYAFNIQGEPFSSWAGPVSVAGGFEYRRETLNTSADAISLLPGPVGFQTNGYVLLPGTPGYSAKDIYVETIVPLAKGLPLAKSLDFNGSFRKTDYSTSGNVNSWKAGLTYEPIEDLLLRGTRSRDIRAPNIFELFSPAGTSVVVSAIAGNIVLNRIGGNASLVPEIADTTTLGFVLKPRMLKRFRFSTDFFKINIGNQIISLPASYIAQVNCAGLNNCLITRSPTGAILSIDSAYSNVSQFSVRGLDIEAAYSQPLGELSSALKGNVDLSFLASHYTKYISSLDGIDRVGQNLNGPVSSTSGPPKWTFNTTATYRQDAFQGSVNVRTIWRGHFDNTLVGPDSPNYSPALPNSISDNVVPSITYVNLSASYDLVKTPSRSIQLYLAVNNVGDRAPPQPAINGAAFYYDLIGRAFKGGVRFKF